MPAIHLSKIHFRPYSEGETPTDFGSAAYSGPERYMDLSTIRFRAWEDPGSSSLGGTDPDGDGGGGEPGGGEGQGDFVMLAYNPGGPDDITAWYDFTPTYTVYAYVEIMITQEWSDAFGAQMSGNPFSGEFLSISTDNDPLSSWEALFFINRNASNVQDGNVYVWDYYGNNSTRTLVTPDVWHTAEIALVEDSGTIYSYWWWDGVPSSDNGVNDAALNGDVSPGFTTIVTGNQYPNFAVPQEWYLDNLKLAYDINVTDGGTVVFTGDVEEGDLSDFTDFVPGGLSVEPTS